VPALALTVAVTMTLFCAWLRDDWLRYHFSYVVVLEHLAFLVLLPSGLQLARILHLPLLTPSVMPWLAAKLTIALGLLLPMEVVDPTRWARVSRAARPLASWARSRGSLWRGCRPGPSRSACACG